MPYYVTNFMEPIIMPSIFDAVKTIINYWNIEALDDESRRINPASGEENQYFNIGTFYQLGSRCDQSAFNLESSKERFDTAQAAADQELEINGNTSAKFLQLAQRLAQSEAHYENAKMLYDLDVDLFNSISGFTWQLGAKIKGDYYGRKWYQQQKEARQARRILAPKAPTEAEVAARRAEMLKRSA
jgi:hypothetical protein